MSARARLLALGVVSLLVVASLALLGFWQLKRLAWKEALIAEVETRAKAPAAPLDADWSALTSTHDEYRRVTLSGAFAKGRSAYLFATPLHPRPGDDTPGYLVITPLLLKDGRIALVNRGFIGADRAAMLEKDDNMAPLAPITITGLLRFDETPRWFQPTDDVKNKIFYTRNVAAIANALGIPHASRFIVDADADAPVAGPEAGQTRIAFPNNHLEYALTWFGLAGAWVVVAGIYLWSARRAPRAKSGAAESGVS
jgi:surfeit locus 1 family protein